MFIFDWELLDILYVVLGGRLSKRIYVFLSLFNIVRCGRLIKRSL